MMKVDRTSMMLSNLSSSFASEGYRLRKAASEFRRDLKSGDACAVWVDLLPASRRGRFKAGVSAHIRIAALEAVYVNYHPLIPAPERGSHFTFVANCDSLFVDKSVAHSVELPDEQSVRVFAHRLWEAIKEGVLPFLERYCDRGRLVENLADEDPRTWVTSDRMTRYAILLSDRALMHDRAGFEHWATEWMDYCRQPHGQMYLPVADAIVPGVRSEYFGK